MDAPPAVSVLREKPLRAAIFFVALAFALSWLAWVPLIKLGAGEEFLNPGAAGPAFAALLLARSGRGAEGANPLRRWLWFAALLIACWILLDLYYANRGSDHFVGQFRELLLIPAAFPAWILSRVFARDDGARGLARRLVHRPTRWTLYAALAFPALQLVPAAIMAALHQPLVWPARRGSASFAVAGGLLFFAYNAVFVGAEEEPGWRGFLLDRLQLRLSPLLATLLVWLPWALWHGPLDYFRPGGMPLAYWLLIRVVMLIPISIILTWFYNRSGRSIQATALFHAGMNTSPFVLPYSQPAMGLIFVWAAWVVISDRMWRRLPDATPSRRT